MEDLRWACQGVDTRKVKSLLAKWPRQRSLQQQQQPGGSDEPANKRAAGAAVVDIGGIDRLEGSTVLHFACAPKKEGRTPIEHLPILRALFIHGAGVFVNRPNFAGDTPLMLTCRANDIGGSHVLLQHGADASQQNRYGDTALHISCRLGYRKLVELLLPTMRRMPPVPVPACMKPVAPSDLKNAIGLTARELAFNHSVRALLDKPPGEANPGLGEITSPGGSSVVEVRKWDASDEARARQKERFEEQQHLQEAGKEESDEDDEPHCKVVTVGGKRKPNWGEVGVGGIFAPPARKVERKASAARAAAAATAANGAPAAAAAAGNTGAFPDNP